MHNLLLLLEQRHIKIKCYCIF